MNIFFDNVNFKSHSGPNSFGRKLAESLIQKGHDVNGENTPDVQLSFIQMGTYVAPVVQRLDGIYFNSEQDWKNLNKPIQQTYDAASGVIFQSEFNRRLSEEFFGKKEKSAVIRNGTCLKFASQFSPIDHPDINKFDNVWTCASSWRPHKRLAENVRYFLEHASDDDCLIVAGNNPDFSIEHPRIFYCGNLSWEVLMQVYRRSKYFIHLALMDHCPNVVVDARSAGCQIICSDSGGTREIAGSDAIVVKDMEWDFSPFKLYEPPALDFSNVVSNADFDNSIDINSCAEQYELFFKEVIGWD